AVSSSTHVGQNTVASAVITWKTNKPTTSRVDYGLDTNYANQTTLDTNLTTSHMVNLANLSADGTVYHYRVRSKDSAGNETVSAIDYTFTTPGTTGGDVKKPSTISNLSSSNLTKNSARLTWSAPSDDYDSPKTGQAASYDVRYSAQEITKTNFTNTSVTNKITGEPTPSIAGKSESMTISGLSPDTKYYVAIESKDEAGNTSAISNIISFTTKQETISQTRPTAPSGGGGGGSFVPVDTTPPSQPTLFKATGTDGQIILTWKNPTDSDFVRVVLLRSETKLSTSIPTKTLLASQDSIYEGTGEEYTDAGLDNGKTYYYYISAYDRNHNYSLVKESSTRPKAGKKTLTTKAKQILFTDNLYFGLKNKEVKKLQEILSKNKDIYPEGITSGYYGSLTAKAIQRFQKKYNIVTSGTPETTGYGVVGPKTREKLNEIYSSFTEQPTNTNVNTTSTAKVKRLFLTDNLYFGLKNTEVKKLQEILSKDTKIYPEGIISGYFGHLTSRAVQRFQCAYNIVCEGNPWTTGYGVFGPKTRKVFNSVYESNKSIINGATVNTSVSHTNTSYSKNITTNLYFGVKNRNSEIKLLQE
ncbi:hypothetical protein MNBD_CPR01-457, partial [hydrothermal vent metagenome]